MAQRSSNISLAKHHVLKRNIKLILSSGSLNTNTDDLYEGIYYGA